MHRSVAQFLVFFMIAKFQRIRVVEMRRNDKKYQRHRKTVMAFIPPHPQKKNIQEQKMTTAFTPSAQIHGFNRNVTAQN